MRGVGCGAANSGGCEDGCSGAGWFVPVLVETLAGCDNAPDVRGGSQEPLAGPGRSAYTCMASTVRQAAGRGGASEIGWAQTSRGS